MEKRNFIILAIALFFLVAGVTTIIIVSHNKIKAEKIEEKQKKEEEKKEKEKEKEKEEDKNLPKFPDLTGLTVEEAAAKLNSLNISSNYSIQREDSELKKSVIVRTDPVAGSPVEGTIDIVFYLSNGNKSFEIEDYEGKDYKEIKKYLEERGVNVTIRRRTPSYERTDVPEDMIIDQSVAAGKTLKSGGSIILYVARVNAKYPNFTDGKYTLEDVQKYCDENELKLNVLYDEVTTYEDGLVFYQDGCLPGEEVKSGCEMTIKVAKH